VRHLILIIIAFLLTVSVLTDCNAQSRKENFEILIKAQNWDEGIYFGNGWVPYQGLKIGNLFIKKTFAQEFTGQEISYSIGQGDFEIETQDLKIVMLVENQLNRLYGELERGEYKLTKEQEEELAKLLLKHKQLKEERNN